MKKKSAAHQEPMTTVNEAKAGKQIEAEIICHQMKASLFLIAEKCLRKTGTYDQWGGRLVWRTIPCGFHDTNPCGGPCGTLLACERTLEFFFELRLASWHARRIDMRSHRKKKKALTKPIIIIIIQMQRKVAVSASSALTGFDNHAENNVNTV